MPINLDRLNNQILKDIAGALGREPPETPGETERLYLALEGLTPVEVFGLYLQWNGILPGRIQAIQLSTALDNIRYAFGDYQP